MDLVLASTSRYRQAQLARLGVPFRSRAPLLEEDLLKVGRMSPKELAEHLAAAKASSYREELPAATVIGADQLVALGDRIFGKPGTVDRAIEQLTYLSGKTHQIITALAVWHTGRIHRHTDVATLRMRPLSRGEIERYVLIEQPIDCAGAYKIESRGITLFESIDSEDHSAIIGLPLIALTTILRGLGFAIP